MLLLFILQNATNNAPQAAEPLEKQPALLSLIYMGGLALMVLLLLLSFLRNRSKRSALAAVAASDLPEEVVQRLGSTATNRGLRFLRWFYVLIALGVFAAHVYWVKYAPESNERFQQLNYKDLRNRRLSETSLRGWILDRSGQLDKALALYKRDAGGNIFRDYPMDEAFAHLFGSDRGDPGLERALFGLQSGAVPEALEIVQGKDIKQQANRDVRLTIDRDLQQEIVNQLKGRHGAVVALNPQTGEVLAMYSNPSYSLKEVQDEATWIRLEADKRDNKLVNRATSEYYTPGSTFKTFMMITAFRNGMQGLTFAGSPGGYVAAPGAKAITDDNGSCEVCGTMTIDQAYEISSNQYFAQMAGALGPQRLRETAKLVGIGAYDSTNDLLLGRKEPDIWNASSDAVKKALAPREATIYTSDKISKYDLALEGFGQGYASQMTPLQMAMLAATAGNLNGNLMKLKIEYDRPPEVYHNVLTPQMALDIRQIMGLVTGGPSGTARGAFASVKAAGIETGGKTGTAQKVMPVYDPKTGEPKKRLKIERDPKGNIIRQYEVLELDEEHPRIDSWFLCIAPLANPQIAIAVIIEGGGYGSRAAAPVAAALVLKARDIGLFGDKPQAGNKNQGTNNQGNKNQGKQNQGTKNQNQNKPRPFGDLN
ncbi:MAG TPA: penicillin-binding transpeptidase domain-containing protein [Pyrinomonadaceae bacterium]